MFGRPCFVWDPLAFQGTNVTLRGCRCHWYPLVLKASILDSGELACVGMLSRNKLKGSWRNVEIMGEVFKFFGSLMGAPG